MKENNFLSYPYALMRVCTYACAHINRFTNTFKRHNFQHKKKNHKKSFEFIYFQIEKKNS